MPVIPAFIWEAEAGGWRVPEQAGLHIQTVSKKKKKEEVVTLP
jgi:hypothetical protein